jgi:multidrug efflux pump
MDVQRINGPDTVGHYNVYPAALIQGATLPGVSSGQAIEKMERICRENLPSQFSFEWTQLTYQEVTAVNTALFIFALFSVIMNIFARVPNRKQQSSISH